MDPSKKILILGASSYVGRHLFQRLGPERAVGTYCHQPIESGVHFNALDMQLSDAVKCPEEFSHAIILIGNTNPDVCACDREGSVELNVTRIRAIIDELVRYGVVPVFTSSESVFDGEKGHYIETDPACPLLMYGAQKVEIERYLQHTCRDFLVLRLAKVFGSRRGDGTLFTAWLDQIERNVSLRCANDQVFSPVHVEEVVQGITILIQGNHRGIFHLSNTESRSRVEMLRSLLKCYQKYQPYLGEVSECRLNDFRLMEKRPLNVSMRPDKLIRATGINFRSIEAWCGIIVDEWMSGGNGRAAV